MSPKSAILYASSSQDVFLIDIPTSLAVAQGDGFNQAPLSCPALKQPWLNTEPKSAVAKAKVQQKQNDLTLDYSYLVDIQKALDELKSCHTGSWCLERPFCDLGRDGVQDIPSDFFSEVVSSLSNKTVIQIPSLPSSWFPLSMIPSYTNETHSTHTISLQPHNLPVERFSIPPGATFSLTSLPPAPLVAQVFDLILLDPPWPNRSARRSAEYGTLATTGDVMGSLKALDLPEIMQADGLLAIWITNKPSIQSAVTTFLDECGLMLVEEWIWIKTTDSGEPILPLDGIWRKPYEILLISKRTDSMARKRSGNEVKKRVIAGVPDLHSRKPCLKELFELVLGVQGEYQALEVFARNLTAGWHSWGDEVSKFNWSGYWKQDNDD